MQSSIFAFEHALQQLSVMTHGAPDTDLEAAAIADPQRAAARLPQCCRVFPDHCILSMDVAPWRKDARFRRWVSLARYGEGVSHPMTGASLAPSVMAEMAPTIPAVSMP